MATVKRGESPSQYGRRPHVRVVPEAVSTTAALASLPPLKQPTGAICAECWPDGWPDETASVGCVHGQWTAEEES